MNCLIKTLQLEGGWYTVYVHPRQRWQMKKCRCPQCGETWQILVPQLKYRIYRIETGGQILSASLVSFGTGSLDPGRKRISVFAWRRTDQDSCRGRLESGGNGPDIYPGRNVYVCQWTAGEEKGLQ